MNKVRKLLLSRETLYGLDAAEMVQALGNVQSNGHVPCYTTVAPDTNVTCALSMAPGCASNDCPKG